MRSLVRLGRNVVEIWYVTRVNDRQAVRGSPTKTVTSCAEQNIVRHASAMPTCPSGGVYVQRW
jgi:hypothetical protein